MENKTAKATKEEVRRYYAATTEDYLKYYQTDWHHHMHFGFDRDLPKDGNPTEQLVKYMSQLAGIDSNDTVLDAGCGVGGSAIWINSQFQCQAIGNTLVPEQAQLAKKFAVAKKSSTGKTAKFIVNDFQIPAFKPNSFNVIWALESFDHSPDKGEWTRQMHRLLKPGGRLIIADGFQAMTAISIQQKNAYQGFLKGWAVPHLCSFEEMKRYGAEAGFDCAYEEDISKDIMPHSRAIFRFGLLFIPLRWLFFKLRWTSSEKLGNAYATYYQYQTLKLGLWKYGVFLFRKKL